MTSPHPSQPPVTPRPEPPMFARILGEGSVCGLCMHMGRQSTKLLLAGGIQACRTCDS